MVVIGSFELILDNYRAVAIEVSRKHVQRVAPYGRFRLLQLQVHSQRIPQLGDVLCQPRREVLRLVGPGFAQVDPFDFRKVGVVILSSRIWSRFLSILQQASMLLDPRGQFEADDRSTDYYRAVVPSESLAVLLFSPEFPCAMSVVLSPPSKFR